MGTERLQVYKCGKCGNIIEVLRGAGPIMVCCGQEMTRMAENTTEAAVEKHVPVVEKIKGGYKVTVGSVKHPMEEKHFIEWIEIVAGGRLYREYLGPGQAPEATFLIDAPNVTARAYCNLHGLWKSA